MTLGFLKKGAFWRKAQAVGFKALLVAVVMAVTWGSLEIKKRVLQDPRLQLLGWRLEFGAFPEWVTDDIRAEIEAIGNGSILGATDGATVGPTVLEHCLLGRVRDELLANPWIASVREIRLHYPGIGEDGAPVAGGLEAGLDLRRPIMAVNWRGRLYLTDSGSRRLGRPYEQLPTPQLKVPIIFGAPEIEDTPPPEPGAVWGRREILEGLAVARELYRAKLHARVDEIDVRNVGGSNPLDPEVVLGVEGFPPLAWGRSPISRGARVLPVVDKLKNLRVVLSDYAGRARRFHLIRLYAAHLPSDPFLPDPSSGPAAQN